MPPSGPDLTYGEKRVIEWWIRSGGSFTENVKMMSPPDDIKELLFKEYGIDFAKKSFYEKAEVSALDQSVIDKIKSQGFNIGTLADNSNFVDVNVKGHSLEWTSERLQSLLEAKIQITWLDLSDSDFGKNLGRSRLQAFSNRFKKTGSFSACVNISAKACSSPKGYRPG